VIRHCRRSFWCRGCASNWPISFRSPTSRSRRRRRNESKPKKARATAEQQHQLVEAVIGVQVSEQNKKRGKASRRRAKARARGRLLKDSGHKPTCSGRDRVLTITLVQQLLKTIQDKPEIVSLIGRLVPQTVGVDGRPRHGPSTALRRSLGR